MKKFFALLLSCTLSMTMLTAWGESTSAPSENASVPAQSTPAPAEESPAPHEMAPTAAESAPTEEPFDMNALYIIPDSSTRRLTEKELWQYRYETLGYIRNEIQARHGYAFHNEKFFAYFNAKPWYTAGDFITMGSSLSELERSNIRTVYEVEALMRERGTTNSTGIDIDDIIEAQNALGGYGDRNDYNNFRGNGEGRHYAVKPEAQKKKELENQSEAQPV